MANEFQAQVAAIVLKNKQLMRIVAQESVQRLINQAQLPKAKGGSMPVDTGFLRASGQGSYSGFPTGPVRGDPEIKYPYSESATITMLAQFTIGATFYFGWTAIYARKQNLYNGFLDKAVANWQKIVNGVVKDIAKRL